MKVKFYVVKGPTDSFKCYVVNKSKKTNKKFILGEQKQEIDEIAGATQLFANGLHFHLFLRELEHCPEYHQRVYQNIKHLNLIIQLLPIQTQFIDYEWGEIVRLLIWEKLECDYLMSWLSTLGGAFSALGDYKSNSAHIAGKISIHQLKMAYRLGDPCLVSRCKLYLSISLIQMNRFKLAQDIIRAEYNFAKATNERLIQKICLGIWSKLQYQYKLFLEERQRAKTSK